MNREGIRGRGQLSTVTLDSTMSGSKSKYLFSKYCLRRTVCGAFIELYAPICLYLFVSSSTRARLPICN